MLEVDNLRTYFHTRHGVVRAVDGISFAVGAGDTLGIVGESGSGKSVACMSLLGLIPSPPGRIESGEARLGGMDLLACSEAELRAVRGKRVAMIFQDPMTALNPYMTIGAQVVEPLEIHEGCPRGEARDRAVAALDEVGIPDAAKRMRAFPHEFSGGMRQRVMIAMALIAQPAVLIADEPTTALDVTVQAQILALIEQIQEARRMAVILITHDLGVVARVCGRVIVMYAGTVLESAATRDLFYNPRHPYTKALMDAMPSARAKEEPLYAIPGMPPDLSEPMAGCPFAPRCTHATEICGKARPVLREVAPGHASACPYIQAGEL